jgi:DeoR family transcriptional regulator of aga operon
MKIIYLNSKDIERKSRRSDAIQKGNNGNMPITVDRRNEIVRLVNTNGRAKVEELSRHFSVSTVTIRNDLNYLEERGLIHRAYGGALTRKEVAFDPTLIEKAKLHAEEKKRIGARAASRIFDGDSIILDSGTTTIEIAKAIKDRKDLTVMTNAINIASELAGLSGVTVMLTGGTLREKSFSLVGPHAESALKAFYFDKLFLGVDGLDAESGLTTPNQLEAQLNRVMIEVSRETVAVVDSSKFGRRSLSLIAPLDRISCIITDSGIPDEYRDLLAEKRIEAVLA